LGMEKTEGGNDEMKFLVFLILKIRALRKRATISPPTCSICGRKMKWFDYGGVSFWYCDYDDNLVEEASP